MAQLLQSGLSTKNWRPNSADSPILFERYQILGIIGEGGMGTVFKGYHLNLKRDVAIKTLRVDHRNCAEMVSRFQKEMESVGQMDHPNVVRATDGGEKNGVFYLVMEYLAGSDLSRLASSTERMDISTACALMRQAALGLEYIHQQKLIHRDIKPSNLFLTTAGQVKILDLGLARFSFADSLDRENTPIGCAVGTYAYMAPEQADGAVDMDGRADLYSLGCTLVKMVTGHAPYSGPEYESAAKVLYAHRYVPVANVESFQAIPQPLRDVVARMMAKNPDHRYQTGKDVAAALAPFIVSDALESSRLLRPNNARLDETPVKPLPWPLPSELSRLTDSPKETPVDTPSATRTFGVRLARPRSWVRWVASACAAAMAVAALLWLAVPEAGPVRDLDRLAPRTPHFLLDHKPFALNHELENPLLCRWMRDADTLDVFGRSSFLFLLGKTTRPRFTFEATLSQTPWTGDLGIFWGYHEDDEIKADRSFLANGTEASDFGWFQMLRLEHKVGAQQEHLFSVSRFQGSVRYNKFGEIATKLFFEAEQPVPWPLHNLATLRIEIKEDRPKLAYLNGMKLDNLYSAETNRNFPPKSARGALGLISVRHTGTFRNARFIIHSNQ